MRRLLSLGVLLLIGACASPPTAAPDLRVAAGFERPAAGSLVVLTPPETDTEALAPGLALLQGQLHAQLQAAGYRVALLEKANHALIWGQEVAAVGGLYDPQSGALRSEAQARALSALGRRVASETKAALVLRARLVLRPATLVGVKADWDGQARVVPARGLAGENIRYSGQTLGLSVELLSLGPQGQLAFRSYGGASMPFRVNAAAERNEVRDDLFASDRELAEGLAIALRPITGNAPSR